MLLKGDVWLDKDTKQVVMYMPSLKLYACCEMGDDVLECARDALIAVSIDLSPTLEWDLFSTSFLVHESNVLELANLIVKRNSQIT